MAMNLVVFLAMVAAEEGRFYPGDDTLLRFGATYAPAVRSGQLWRLVTSMFVHIDVFHLAFNMIVLWNIGPYVERWVGARWLVLVYLASGASGNVLSTIAQPSMMSAGASGAILGLYGCAAIVLVRSRGRLLKARRAVVPAVVSVLLITAMVIQGVILSPGPGTDSAAHLGGSVAGAILALMVPMAPSSPTESGPEADAVK